MSHAVPLPRLDRLDRFYDDYFLCGRPVVISNGARGMPAFARWTDDYLRETIGEVRQLVTLSDERRGLMLVKDYLPYLNDPEQFASSQGAIYMTDIYLRPSLRGKVLDRLAPDIRCPLYFGGPVAESRTLFLGPKGTATLMHEDQFAMHAWMAELRGHKDWRICPPGSFAPGSYGAVDAFGEADLGCEVFEARVCPGDVLYLPPHWWHQVKNLDATVAIYGHFLAPEEARSSLARARASEGVRERNWAEVWSSVLELPLLPYEGPVLSPLGIPAAPIPFDDIRAADMQSEPGKGILPNTDRSPTPAGY